jgi:hypothetical protein
LVNRLLSTRAAAIYLALSDETLRSWRRRGIGPPYLKVEGAHIGQGGRLWKQKRHGHVLYPRDGLDEFIAKQAVQNGRLPRPISGRMPKVNRRRGTMAVTRASP